MRHTEAPETPRTNRPGLSASVPRCVVIRPSPNHRRIRNSLGSSRQAQDLGERDTFGVGFSDNVIFRKQYYVRAVAEGDAEPGGSFANVKMYLYRDENFATTAGADEMTRDGSVWSCKVGGTGFEARLGVSLEMVTE